MVVEHEPASRSLASHEARIYSFPGVFRTANQLTAMASVH